MPDCDSSPSKLRINVYDPVGYFDMLELLKHCLLVVTDSGGLQKEAFFNKKPCIIAREETEWTELVANGFATLVGSSKQKMLEAFQIYNNIALDYSINLYGNEIGVSIYNKLKNSILS